eukprot:UN14721
MTSFLDQMKRSNIEASEKIWNIVFQSGIITTNETMKILTDLCEKRNVHKNSESYNKNNL